jgi:hypothetical protein
MVLSLPLSTRTEETLLIVAMQLLDAAHSLLFFASLPDTPILMKSAMLENIPLKPPTDFDSMEPELFLGTKET